MIADVYKVDILIVRKRAKHVYAYYTILKISWFVQMQSTHTHTR